jgi:hypothetical protein
MQDFTIQPEAGKKGRSFSAKCTALVVADSLWASGSGDSMRPIWAQFVGSDAELRPFATNLKLGRKAEPTHGRPSACDRIEFLRSANYQVAWQRESEGTILTLFHPELFRLDPGMVDPEGATFVMLVPRWWTAAQTLDPDAARASLFAAYLDRRTRCPLVNDVAFYVTLFAAALECGLARMPTDRSVKYARGPLAAEGLEQAGVDTVVVFSASHDELETFLAEQVGAYFEEKRDA